MQSEMPVSREVFSNPPVVLVAAEVRYTDAPRLRRQETLDAVAIALESRFPFTEALTGANLAEQGPGLPPRLEPRHGVICRDADSTESLTVTPASLIYETTRYGGFESVQAAIGQGCRALVGSDVRPGVKRVGLRYINEVRVPDPVADVRAWSTWIDSSLLGPLAVAPDHVPSRGIQGAVAFDLGGQGGLNFQYAAFGQGASTVPGHLRREPFQPGPFFGLDLDGFYEAREETTAHLDPAVVADILGALHGPIGAAFRRSLTGDARALFREDPGRNGWSARPPRHRGGTDLTAASDAPHPSVGRETDTLN